MPVAGSWEKKKVLITARTYPTPARKGVEVSCTAGITDQGEWIRLFPISYRFLESDRRFRKYQWIEVEVAKSPDPRPESFEVKPDSLRIISEPLPTKSNWKSRTDVIFPLKSHCLCCLQRDRNRDKYPTLGFYKPRSIQRLIIEEEDPEWSEAELAKLSQQSMFDTAPPKILEKIPYKFKYQVLCSEPTCRGHRLSCTDWEIGEAYRKWSKKYGSIWEDKFRQRFEFDMLTRFDTHLFVGTVKNHPASWIIVGLFYPPRKVSSHPPQVRRSSYPLNKTSTQPPLPFFN